MVARTIPDGVGMRGCVVAAIGMVVVDDVIEQPVVDASSADCDAPSRIARLNDRVVHDRVVRRSRPTVPTEKGNAGCVVIVDEIVGES